MPNYSEFEIVVTGPMEQLLRIEVMLGASIDHNADQREVFILFLPEIWGDFTEDLEWEWTPENAVVSVEAEPHAVRDWKPYSGLGLEDGKLRFAGCAHWVAPVQVAHRISELFHDVQVYTGEMVSYELCHEWESKAGKTELVDRYFVTRDQRIVDHNGLPYSPKRSSQHDVKP